MAIALAQLERIMPAAGARAAAFLAPLNAAMAEFAIDTPGRQAAFLAQVAHESGQLAFLVENLNYSARRLAQVFPRRFKFGEAARYARQPARIASRIYADRMGNGNEASGDGWKYRGRGLIQVTGRDNYHRASLALYRDDRLLDTPGLLEQPGPAARSAAWFWQSNGLNAIADRGDIALITRRVNGGVNGLADRVAYYTRAQEVLV